MHWDSACIILYLYCIYIALLTVHINQKRMHTNQKSFKVMYAVHDLPYADSSHVRMFMTALCTYCKIDQEGYMAFPERSRFSILGHISLFLLRSDRNS